MTIDRHNWKEHCAEPQLTADEWRRWEAVTKRIRNDENFADRVIALTETEFQAERAAGELPGWAGLVAWADASRQYKRAVIVVGENIKAACSHTPFSKDLEYQHNAYFRDYYCCRVCGTQVSRPECRFGGYIGY
jgi:hypothetical protein